MKIYGYALGARRRAGCRAALGVAVTLALGSAAASAPAYATEGSPTPAVTAEAATGKPAAWRAVTDPLPGDEGLAEAVERDLGMTLEEFNAAGAQAKRAADAPAANPNPAPSEIAAAETAEAGELQANSVEQLYRAYLRDVGPHGLQAVAEAGGKFIIRTGDVNSRETAGRPGRQPTAGEGPGGRASPQAGREADSQGAGRRGEAAGTPGMSPSDFVQKYANVVLEHGDPLASEEDFLGGQGYRVDGGGVVCSAGFSAFSPAGKPLVLTAGHCADDGAAKLTEITLPAGDPAGGAVAGSAVTGELGTFGFSQFGGPGNAWVTGDPEDPGDPGKDIAVVESIRAGLNLLPAATTWEDPAALGRGSVQIVGTAAPVVGQFVCRSGRTEGWSCGVVDEVGIYVVGGPSGEPEDLRSFRGFLSYSVQSAGGDSGGPWISGNYAVGTHSAGNSRRSVENYAVAATLQDSLQVLPGVELRLFLNQPVLTVPLPAGPIEEGQRISGRIPELPGTSVPAGSSVRVTFPGVEPLEVPADAAGMWSFVAPASTSEFSAQAFNGFSSSAVSAFRSPAQPAAPAPAPSDPSDPVQPDPVQPNSTPGGPTGSGAAGEDTPAGPKPVRPVAPAVLTPAPEPSVVAVQPQGHANSWAAPTAAAALADTGASGLPLAAGGAAAALIAGGLLLVAAGRRRR